MGQCKRNCFRVQLKSKHQRTALFDIICLNWINRIHKNFLWLHCNTKVMLLQIKKQAFRWLSGFKAQLVRASHRYREVTGSNPVKSWLFQASIRNCLNCVHNYDDHGLFDYSLCYIQLESVATSYPRGKYNSMSCSISTLIGSECGTTSGQPIGCMLYKGWHSSEIEYFRSGCPAEAVHCVGGGSGDQ